MQEVSMNQRPCNDPPKSLSFSRVNTQPKKAIPQEKIYNMDSPNQHYKGDWERKGLLKPYDKFFIFQMFLFDKRVGGIVCLSLS